MKPARTIHVDGRRIGHDQPTYFIADIAANHDGDLDRAKNLIAAAARAGADAAKFQHFQAATIVSDHGFRSLGGQRSHQAKWGKSVFEVYRDASVDLGWTEVLVRACRDAGIAFMTSPYSPELVETVAPYVDAFKIGSGDITWHAIIDRIAAHGKPVMIATGASTGDEVVEAMARLLASTGDVVLMQCNTNYTGDIGNFAFSQLNVLKAYAAMFPDAILGLSDHTPGHATVLGAIALGARVVEKHFTDDRSRTGPDHGFSMSPIDWREMVDRSRELEAALGNGIKKVEPNESETVVLQRRCVRAARDIAAGGRLTADDLTVLRPCPAGAIPPSRIDSIVGRATRRDIATGEHLTWADVG